VEAYENKAFEILNEVGGNFDLFQRIAGANSCNGLGLFTRSIQREKTKHQLI